MLSLIKPGIIQRSVIAVILVFAPENLSCHSIPIIPRDSATVHSLSFIQSSGDSYLLEVNAGRAVSATTRLSEIKYSGHFSKGIFLNFSLYQNQNISSFDDSSTQVTVTDISTPGACLEIKVGSGRNNVGAMLAISKQLGVQGLNLRYFHVGHHLILGAAVETKRQRFSVNIGNHDRVYTGDVKRVLSTLSSDISLHFTAVEGSFRTWRSISTPYDVSSKQGLSIDLRPFQAGFDLKGLVLLNSRVAVNIFYKGVMDTTNAEILSATSTIGKFYAFDQSKREYGFSIEFQDAAISLSRNAMMGYISGFVLASYFGDILTQLSGARYYQRFNVKLSWYDLSISKSTDWGNRTRISVKNALLMGTGNIYSRHHIFQLFNPLTDLAVQEINISRFVLNDLELRFMINLSPRLNLTLGGGYLLPLRLDLEVHPDQGLEITRSQVGPRGDIQIKYSFLP